MRYCTIREDDPLNPAPVRFDPYDYQRDLVTRWDAGESMVLLKARQLGISWVIAAYMFRRAAFNGWSIGYYSRGEAEAVAELEQRVLHLWESMPVWLRPNYRRRGPLVEFDGGGSIRVFPATRAAGIGYTMQLIVADEAAHHEWGAMNYVNYAPALSAGGQYIAFSTADHELGPSGFFYDLYQRSANGETGYTAEFLPWHVRPGRGQRGGDWWTRERARYASLTEDTFNSQYPETPAEAFVGRSGLVYPQFEHSRHVRPDPCRWEECIARYAGYDLGGGGDGDPTAIVALGVYRAADGSRRVHQFGEYYQQQGVPTVDKISAWLLEWHQRARFDHIERDPVGATSTINETLSAVYGLPVGAEPVSRDKSERLQTQSYWLDSGLFTIGEKCTYSIAEFPGYRWRESTDPNDKTRYKTSTPVDHHGDAMDARGQALIRVYADEMNVGMGQRSAEVRYW